MRIAMITLNVYDNYGNMLQKYALYRTLKKFAEFVEVLWYPENKPFYPYKLESDPLKEGNLKNTAFWSVREYKIKQFNDTNMRTRFDIPYLEELADEYDFFVVGSNQVWNPEINLPNRFLDFAPPEKRIAYAASIEASKIPEEAQETYRQKILEMPHVSVREKESCDLIEKITGKRPVHFLDPVFLLTADEWRALEKRPTWFKDSIYERGYLLTYWLNGKPPKEIKFLAAKFGLPLINLLDLNNFNHYATGIEEFLYLIDHATFLCLQSFYGTAFATLFKKPFMVYKTDKLLQKKFYFLGSLLDLFGLSDRVAEADFEIKSDDLLKIDFTRLEELLPPERKKAFKFLAEALWQ